MDFSCLSGCWIQAFLLIFFSEIGDKTFFIAVCSSICFVCLTAVKFSFLDIKIHENLKQEKMKMFISNSMI